MSCSGLAVGITVELSSQSFLFRRTALNARSWDMVALATLRWMTMIAIPLQWSQRAIHTQGNSRCHNLE